MGWVVLFFLAASLYLYCLLGGADFGAGVLELFVKKEDREKHEKLAVQAMGPVWEANHMWLIIVIVILFNGFPKAYSTVSIYFHLPLTLMLIGIILRGCAFIFRSYDAVRDRSRKYYSLVFSLSSVLAPLMLGVVMGGLFYGVDAGARGYRELYVDPWLNWFAFSVGFFVLSIFVFLASVFMIGEDRTGEFREYFIRRAKAMNAITVAAGAFVFLAAELNGISLLGLYLRSTRSMPCRIAATFSLFFFWNFVSRGSVWRSRMAAGFQLAMILGAWFSVLFPHMLFFRNGDSLDFWEAAAPPLPMAILGWSLILGAIFFAPALYYLFAVFKGNVPEKKMIQ